MLKNLSLEIKIVLAVSVWMAGSFFISDVALAQAYHKDKIYQYLKAQQNLRTGLVDSFTNTSDEMLIHQASTYDQALAAITFVLMEDYKSAARILDFFNTRWSGDGFANFYHVQTGEVGLEATVHLGPNAWIAIAALQFDATTGQRRFYELAHKIGLWMKDLSHDPHGGIAMGPRADWGANWREVFSAENNISAFGAFQGLQLVAVSPEDQKVFAREAEGIKRFLTKEIFARKPRIPVGPDNDFMASDVFAFAILAFSPMELERDMDVEPAEMLQTVEKNFFVMTDDISGYDFADFNSRQSFERRPMISMEWSAMIALAYFRVGDYYEQMGQLMPDAAMLQQSKTYLQKSKEIIENLDKKAILHGQGQLVYPYATKAWEQVFPFASWWRTPQRGDRGRLAGALSGTCWRVFAEEKMNPFYFKRSKQ